MQRIFSALTAAIGIVLMAFMIIEESERGVISLLLITIGVGWYFFTRYKMRSQYMAR